MSLFQCFGPDLARRRSAGGGRPVLAVSVRADAIRLGAASVLDPADVCEDGAAETRRRAGGVVGRDGVLSDGVAGRLCLRPSVEPRCCGRAGLRCSICVLVGVTAMMLPIAIAPGWVASAAGWNGALAVRTVCGLDRPSVLHAVGQRAAAAKLVCREWAQAGGQSLCALRRVQSRLVCRAVRLSRRHRAVPDAEDADRGLVVRICAACQCS